MLWLNTHIRYRNEMLLFKNWIKSNIVFVGDIVNKDGILSMPKLRETMQVYDGRFLSEYARCRVALKSAWPIQFNTDDVKQFKEHRSNIALENKYVFFKHDKLSPLTKTKDIYREMRTWNTTESRAISFWTQTLKTSTNANWKNIWNFKLIKVQDNALIQFNYKFMYDVITTLKNLFNWKIKNHNKCPFCIEIGSLLHMFYYCPVLKSFWKYVEYIVKRYTYDITLTIDPEILIYGFDFSKANLIDLIINYALLSVYRTMLLFYEGRYYAENEFVIMFKSIIKKRYQIEKLKTKQCAFSNAAEWVKLINLL